jgi:DNA-binding GntR family transcriptional regulator
LQRTLDQLQKVAGRDSAAEIEKHLAFHWFFYAHSGNQTLLAKWIDWEAKLRLFFIADHAAFENSRDVAGVHEELINVIRDGDADRIRTAFSHHVHNAPGTEAGDPLHAERPTGRTCRTA